MEESQLAELAPGGGDPALTRIKVSRVRVGRLGVITSHGFQSRAQRRDINRADFAVELELPPESRAFAGALPVLVDEETHQQRHRRKPQYDFVVRHDLGLLGKPSPNLWRMARPGTGRAPHSVRAAGAKHFTRISRIDANSAAAPLSDGKNRARIFPGAVCSLIFWKDVSSTTFSSWQTSLL